MRVILVQEFCAGVHAVCMVSVPIAQTNPLLPRAFGSQGCSRSRHSNWRPFTPKIVRLLAIEQHSTSVLASLDLVVVNPSNLILDPQKSSLLLKSELCFKLARVGFALRCRNHGTWKFVRLITGSLHVDR